ncbi:hypothetical protein J4414_01850 [Candidatus Woesearchaeota archaeon]|nr:hypothetical protein [Candidatus Woesearchaeota archaeon]
MVVTALTPYIGYEKAAQVAKKAYKEDRSVKEILLEKKLLSRNLVNKIFDFKSMTKLKR